MESIQAVARKLGDIQKAHITNFVAQDYVSEFKFGLVEVVFEWARGMVSGNNSFFLHGIFTVMVKLPG